MCCLLVSLVPGCIQGQVSDLQTAALEKMEAVVPFFKKFESGASHMQCALAVSVREQGCSPCHISGVRLADRAPTGHLP